MPRVCIRWPVHSGPRHAWSSHLPVAGGWRTPACQSGGSGALPLGPSLVSCPCCPGRFSPPPESSLSIFSLFFLCVLPVLVTPSVRNDPQVLRQPLERNPAAGGVCRAKLPPPRFQLFHQPKKIKKPISFGHHPQVPSLPHPWTSTNVFSLPLNLPLLHFCRRGSFTM